MAARTDHSIRRRLRKAGAIAFRLFVVYSLIYTLFSLLLDSRSTDYLGISETACTAQFIDADSPEELRQRLIDEFAPTLVFSFRSEEHTSELQSRENLVCRLLLEKKNPLP